MYITLTTINFITHVLYSMCQYQNKTIQRERDKREGERGTDSNRDTNIERNRKRERESLFTCKVNLEFPVPGPVCIPVLDSVPGTNRTLKFKTPS